MFLISLDSDDTEWAKPNFSHRQLLTNATQYIRFFQNISCFKVNGGFLNMHPCLEPFERALHLKVFGQVLVALFELMFENFSLGKLVSQT